MPLPGFVGEGKGPDRQGRYLFKLLSDDDYYQRWHIQVDPISGKLTVVAENLPHHPDEKRR